ncbi:MAG: tetratricopeptide repeat protein, partial [Terriglobia bacterium]
PGHGWFWNRLRLWREAGLTCLFLSVLVSAAAAHSIAPAGATFQHLIAQAQAAGQRGDYLAAARDYQEALKRNPDSPETWANLGLMEYLLGDYSRAQGCLEKALRQQPGIFPANLFLGLDLLNQDRPQQALPYLLKAQRIKPHDERAPLALGEAWVSLGKFNASISAYSRVLRMNPNSGDALYGRGMAYMEVQRRSVKNLAHAPRGAFYQQMLLAESFIHEGRAADAVRILQRLVVPPRTPPGLHTALGLAYLDSNNRSQAAAAFHEELKTHPGFLPAHMGLARLNLEYGDTGNCIRELEIAWRTDRRFTQSWLTSLWSNQSVKQTEVSLGRLRAAVSEATDPALAKCLMTGLQGQDSHPVADITKGLRPDAGGEYATSIRRANPADGEAVATLFEQGRYTQCEQAPGKDFTGLSQAVRLLVAQCGYYAGDDQTAYLASRSALVIKPDDPAGLYWEAKTAERAAMNDFTSMASAGPNFYKTHLLLGEAYGTMQHYKASEIQYQDALRLNPSGLGARLGLAITYWKELKLDQAVVQLGTVLAARPQDPQANYILGNVLVTKHDFAGARSHLLIALQGVNGQTALYTHALLGRVDEFQDHLAAAAAELKQSLPADDDGSLHYQLYEVYWRLGDRTQAQAALRQSQEIRKQNEAKAMVAITLSERSGKQ